MVDLSPICLLDHQSHCLLTLQASLQYAICKFIFSSVRSISFEVKHVLVHLVSFLELHELIVHSLESQLQPICCIVILCVQFLQLVVLLSKLSDHICSKA